MKKIYTLILAITICISTLKAQLTLTKSANEPSSGDISIIQNYDSVGIIPKNTGQNQLWNFSSAKQSTDTPFTFSFTLVSTIPSSSLFPGCSMANPQSTSYIGFFKSSNSPSQLEYLGDYSSGSMGSMSTYTNTQIQYQWPISYGTNYTDTYGGTYSGYETGYFTGSWNLSATGSGTIILPGGQEMTNILQVKIVETEADIYVTPTPSFSTNITAIVYQYFHASQKFPVLSVVDQYITQSGLTSNYIRINFNKNVVLGITDKNFDATFTIFPNPAMDYFNVELSNPNNENCEIEIYNSTGQLSKKINLGSSTIKNKINISDLSSGIYSVKTLLGEKFSIRKLIIE